jgi:hypothetical protein
MQPAGRPAAWSPRKDAPRMARKNGGAARRGRPAQDAPIDPAELAAGCWGTIYRALTELFQDEPFILRSQEVTERPFLPSAAVQFTMPDLPPVDWEHIRRKQAEQRRARRSRNAPQPPAIFIAPAERKDGER